MININTQWDGIKMAENRVDPTITGIFLIAFITLAVGLVGLLAAMENAAGFDGFLALNDTLVNYCALAFLLLAIVAAYVGNSFSTALFAIVGISMYAADDFILCIISAVLFIVFGLVSLLNGSPKLLFIILLFVALMYFILGIFANSVTGELADGDLVYGWLFGIFGLLAGVMSIYLGLALTTQKLPVF